jgi:hypothetical protein
MKSPKSRLLALLLASVWLSAALFGQESRGSITGRVSDPQGAMIAGATVTVTNTKTNETRTTTTNQTGYYEVVFLEPSDYTVTAELTGFKRTVRSGVTVNVASRLDIPIELAIGEVAETVTVTEETPLLDTTSASGGRVLDQQQLVNLPFSDLNPFALSALAPGMQWTGQPEYRRPFDNAGTSAFSTAGGVGQNEYTIDGQPVTGTNRRVGYVPPSDAITEFKLETANFDASNGFSSGALVNVVSRGGTNELHGSLFNQHWQQRWNATPHFTRLKWEDDVRAGRISPDSQKQATGRSNNYGFTAAGPVFIPKLVDLRNKVFWTFTYNGIKQSKAETTSSVNATVPQEAWFQGDFSQMLSAPNGANLFTIYDPRSASLQNGRVVRTPFPNNRGIPTLNPMAAFYARVFPKPNNVPGLVSAEGYNNYLAFSMPKNEDFYALQNRNDWVISQNHRMNVRWQYNNRLANEYDWTYESFPGLHSNGLTRINKGAGINYLWTLSANHILDTSVSYSRFEEGSTRVVPLQFGPSDVGLPDYLEARAGDNRVLPRLDFNNLNDVSDSYPVIGGIGTTGEVRVTMTSIKGNHTLKYGMQHRLNWWTGRGPGFSSGRFTFRNNWTRRADNDNVSAQHAHEFAAFLMGLPNGIDIDTNDSVFLSTPRTGLFIQDDFRLTDKLRLSLGLRWEREGGMSERFNRGIAGDFIGDLQQPFTALAKAAYAASPIPQVDPANFNPVGGTAYLGTGRYDTFTKGSSVFLPKLGIVWSLNNKTVFRAGYGMYSDTLNSTNTRPDTFGYNQATATPITNDAGLTFCCGVGAAAGIATGNTPVSNPFPTRADGSRFDEPYQAALGGLPRVGRGFTGSIPWDFYPARQHRWRIGVQRELARNLVVDVSYNGAFSKIPVNQRVDFLPEQYWTTGMLRNQDNDNVLNQNVPNPFNIQKLAALQTSDPALYRYMSGQGFFTNSVIRRHQLIRQYGFMGEVQGLRPGVDFEDALGAVKYHDLQVLVERRFTAGLATSFMYTGATGTEEDYYYNQFDSAPSSRPADQIRPHRIAWSGSYELPIGKNRKWVQEGFMSHVIGNWNIGWIYQRQGGAPTDWGNRFFYGDLENIDALFKSDEMRAKDIHTWFDPSIAFRGTGAIPSGFQGFEGRANQQPGEYHVRMFPYRLDSLRQDGIRNWDIKVERIFPITETARARFSVDALNATNHTNFSNPNTDPTNSNFGRVTSQRGLSRVIQFTLRVEF